MATTADLEPTDIITYLAVGTTIFVVGALGEVLMSFAAFVITRQLLIHGVLR